MRADKRREIYSEGYQLPVYIEDLILKILLNASIILPNKNKFIIMQ
jgi:hypothetical protein